MKESFEARNESASRASASSGDEERMANQIDLPGWMSNLLRMMLAEIGWMITRTIRIVSQCNLYFSSDILSRL